MLLLHLDRLFEMVRQRCVNPFFHRIDYPKSYYFNVSTQYAYNCKHSNWLLSSIRRSSLAQSSWRRSASCWCCCCFGSAPPWHASTSTCWVTSTVTMSRKDIIGGASSSSTRWCSSSAPFALSAASFRCRLSSEVGCFSCSCRVIHIITFLTPQVIHPRRKMLPLLCSHRILRCSMCWRACCSMHPRRWPRRTLSRFPSSEVRVSAKVKKSDN